jgi:microcystin degradation protein MlrC
VIEAPASTPDLPNLLLLTARRAGGTSTQQLTGVDIHPESLRIIVVKGTIAPRRSWQPVAARIIEVDTPGATTVDPARFSYKHVRRPLFGLAQ